MSSIGASPRLCPGFSWTGLADVLRTKTVALCKGCPTVVAPSIGGIPELVRDGETGFLYPPGDLQQLSRLLVRLLRDPEYAQSLGRAGRDRVLTELNATRMSNEIARHYSELANALPVRGGDAGGMCQSSDR